MVDSQFGATRLFRYNHLISNKREWNNCFIKNAHKVLQKFFPTIFVKTTDFQLVLDFEQTRIVTIFGVHGIKGPYNMMAKRIRALELLYPLIQFFI